MKVLMVGFFFAVASLAAAAAETAQVRIDCLSLRFEPASGGPGQAATMELSSDKTFSEVNGELWPLYDDTLPSHGSFFRLEDPTFPDSLVGNIAFETPQPTDANRNGFDDFFERSQEVASATRHGLFITPVEEGSVLATWSRAAGSSVGTCRLTLIGDTFGELPEFQMNFQLLELTGTFQFTRATNSVPGLLTLAEPGNPANTLTGRLEFVRVPTNHFDAVTFAAGNLTNATGQALGFEDGSLERDGTNYFGFLDLVDGDLTTGTADYLSWILSIDDPNDSDGDGVPDFTDDLGEVPAVPPKLTLSRTADHLLLTIEGAAGLTVGLEQTGSLDAPWAKTVSAALTNSPQALTLSIPESSPRFWRVRIQP